MNIIKTVNYKNLRFFGCHLKNKQMLYVNGYNIIINAYVPKSSHLQIKTKGNNKIYKAYIHDRHLNESRIYHYNFNPHIDWKIIKLIRSHDIINGNVQVDVMPNVTASINILGNSNDVIISRHSIAAQRMINKLNNKDKSRNNPKVFNWLGIPD